MTKAIEYKRSIDLQINHNRSKNLFFNSPKNVLSFAPETITNIDMVRKMNGREQELLINYVVQKVLQEFCRINQYISFSDSDKKSLSNLYLELLLQIKAGEESPQKLAEKHYQNIRSWLIKSNPFVQELYSNQGKYLDAVCCAEYNAPALPFIEPFLEDTEFHFSNFEIENLELQSTIIKRSAKNAHKTSDNP